MESLSEESSCETSSNINKFNDFFGEFEKPPEKTQKAPQPSQRIPSLTSQSKSYCASWVNDQGFRVLPIEKPRETPEFCGSPLSESVHSCIGFNAKKRLKSAEKEQEEERKRQKEDSNSPISNLSFFAKLASAEKEIQEKSEKWVKINGIWVDKEEEYESSNRILTKYEEIMSLFVENRRLFDSLTLEYSYPFDWKLYSENRMQFVVFTKLCQSHPEGETVEMRKEDKKCTDCGSSNLAFTVRLTAPLDLSEISIPCFEDIQIHVAFPAEKLLEKSGYDSLEIFEKSNEFSKEKCQLMYHSYEGLLKGRESQQYREWFDKCRMLVQKSLSSKRLFLTLGRVVRQKTEDTISSQKRRCFIFATSFDLVPI